MSGYMGYIRFRLHGFEVTGHESKCALCGTMSGTRHIAGLCPRTSVATPLKNLTPQHQNLTRL